MEARRRSNGFSDWRILPFPGGRARECENRGADYIFFGPVYATPSKSAYGAPQGIEKLREVCKSVAIPVLAIGGVHWENTRECVAAGASGLAAIRWFQDAADAVELAAQIKKIRSAR